LDFGNWQTQLRKGLLDIVVLNLLEHGQCHGYDMVRTLKQMGGLELREGNIYPILARLQTDGLVASFSEASRDGPPRRYFKLTALGRRALADMNAHWEQVLKSIENVRRGVQK
jgi:PadR family transcriptional regulator PadR